MNDLSRSELDEMRDDQQRTLAAISVALGPVGLKTLPVDATKSAVDEYSARRVIVEHLASDDDLRPLVADLESRYHWMRTRDLFRSVGPAGDPGESGRLRAASIATGRWFAAHPAPEVGDGEADRETREALLGLQALLLLADELSPT